MTSRPAFRERDDVEVRILEALIDRSEEGMTVFELRAAVDEDIDTIETALAALKRDGYIDVEKNGDRTRIKPSSRIDLDPDPGTDRSVFDEIRERLPF